MAVDPNAPISGGTQHSSAGGRYTIRLNEFDLAGGLAVHLGLAFGNQQIHGGAFNTQDGHMQAMTWGGGAAVQGAVYNGYPFDGGPDSERTIFSTNDPAQYHYMQTVAALTLNAINQRHGEYNLLSCNSNSVIATICAAMGTEMDNTGWAPGGDNILLHPEVIEQIREQARSGQMTHMTLDTMNANAVGNRLISQAQREGPPRDMDDGHSKPADGPIVASVATTQTPDPGNIPHNRPGPGPTRDI